MATSGSAPSFQDFVDIGTAEILDRRSELSLYEGDVSLTQVDAGAAMADSLVGYTNRKFKATFLDGAFGDDLDVLANDRWNLQREGGGFASGFVYFSRPSGGLAGTIMSGTVVGTDQDAFGNDVQFTLDADLAVSSVASGAIGSGSCTAIAAGPAGNVVSGSITRFVSAVFDTSINVYNSASFAGGSDEEPDPDFKDRVRNFPNNIQRGTYSALEYGARQVPGVATATAVDLLDENGQKTGIVNVYIADANGNSSPGLIQAVQTEEANWAPAGMIYNVYGGSLYTLEGIVVRLTIRANQGVTVAQLTSNVISAIVNAVNSLKIGETCSRSLISTAAKNVDPNVIGCDVTSPAADVAPPTFNSLIRTSAAQVSVQ